jgi:acyl-CoA synthetase (AMP-forming)/AMP-acid ligase II
MTTHVRHVYTSPFPPLPIPDLPITALVLAHAARLADKPALVDAASGRTLTYGALRDQAQHFAANLTSCGFRPRDVVAILMPNLPEYAVAFHGVLLAGGVCTTVNPGYTAGEIHHQCLDAGATRLVTVPACLDVARAAAAGTGVQEILVVGGEPAAIAAAASAARAAGLGGPSVTPFAAMLLPPAGGPPPLRHAASPDDLVVLPYSSGTTGVSKGVMLTHRNLVANVVQTSALVGLRESDVMMAVLPFFHIYGMQVMMNCGLAAGATLVTMPRFDLEVFLRAHQQHRITYCYVAPPIVVALAKHPMVGQFDLSALRFMLSGAAPLSADVAAEAGRRIGCEIVQGYGMTELSPVSHFTPPGRNRAGASGLTVPNTECLIVDPESGEALGPGSDGELWIRGPQVMRGYLNQPEATAATLDAEGWLHTGDIAHFDADGYLFIVDRLKELIKYKGFQVPPAELEALLLTHPAIADAAVIGLPDAEAGELPAAFVVLKPGAQATDHEVMAFVAKQVAHYKQLRRVTFIDAVPKSASGKILRRLLRAAAT